MSMASVHGATFKEVSGRAKGDTMHTIIAACNSLLRETLLELLNQHEHELIIHVIDITYRST